MIGQTLDHYRIESKLGEGGMGVVYLARDTHLDRTVAIKLLPADKVADPARKQRFIQEAKSASALNHPNIVTIYDIRSQDGTDFIVMERIEGQTLENLIAGKAIRPPEAIQYAVQIAGALAKAHGAGIIHRDLKPSNIMVDGEGRIKILDFGLAKLLEPADVSPGGSTVTMRELTEEGTVIGTAPYMSPEQAEGRAVDARSDIFSFGSVLYEMLSGRKPFAGDSRLSILTKILNEDPPPLARVTPSVPPELEKIILRCLRKDPARRFQTAADLKLALEDLQVESATGKKVRAPQRRRLAWAALVAVLLLAGFSAWRFWPVRAAPHIRSIAVLPLQNLSGDAAQEYFSDGTTEALISALAQIRALKVISRTSVMRYKGGTRSLPEIGRELGVDAVVEGSVQRSGGRVRVTAQLIQAATDTHLWAGSYDQDLSDVLKLESEVARAIAREIQVQLTPHEAQRLNTARRIDPAAQDAYLQGRYHFWKTNEQDLKEAIQYFEEAIRVQPDYAAGHAGLSHALHERGIWGAAGFRDLEAASKNAARKALELDPDLADAHAALGETFCSYDWNWMDAEKEFRRSIELDSNCLECSFYFGTFLEVMGRFSEAVREAERGLSIDPVSSTAQSHMGRILYRAGRYAEAESHYRKSIELDSQNFSAYTRLAELYETTGRTAQALPLIEQALRIRGADLIKSADLGRIYAELGRRAEAVKVLNAVINARRPNSIEGIARIYFALGDRDHGFEWLTKAFDQRQIVIFTKFDPRYDEIRSDPRFQALVARLGIPDP